MKGRWAPRPRSFWSMSLLLYYNDAIPIWDCRQLHHNDDLPVWDCRQFDGQSLPLPTFSHGPQEVHQSPPQHPSGLSLLCVYPWGWWPWWASDLPAEESHDWWLMVHHKSAERPGGWTLTAWSRHGHQDYNSQHQPAKHLFNKKHYSNWPYHRQKCTQQYN